MIQAFHKNKNQIEEKTLKIHIKETVIFVKKLD